MKLHIRHLSDIPAIKKDGRIYVSIDDFFTTVAQREKCKEADLRKYNFIRRNKDDTIHVPINANQNKSFCPLVAFIHYCCDSGKKYETCKDICSDIEKLLSSPDGSVNVTVRKDRTILDIYQDVAKLNFGKVSSHMEHALKIFDVRRPVPSLYDCHKDAFTDELHWKKIVFFEWHFHLQHGTQAQTIEKEVQAREKFLSTLINATSLSQTIVKSAKETVKRRNQRSTIGNQDKIQLDFSPFASHFPSVLEQDIVAQLDDEFPEFNGSVVVLNCSKECHEKDHGAHVFIEVNTSNIGGKFDDLFGLINLSLLNKHNLPCAHIQCYQDEEIANYVQEGKKFKLRDDIQLGKFSESMVCEWISPHTDISDEMETCGTCNPQHDFLKPLHWSSFEVEEEWVMDVPFVMQVLLESFINNISIQNTKELASLLKEKTVRLYGLHDSLLNVMNKKYHGIMQELNTSEVMVNYHNLSDIFHLTNVMGVTKCQSAAERNWKERATHDCAYFHYAIKKWPLEYETVAGIILRYVSLRGDCIKIGTRDNLVQLTHKSNPEPGASRTGQVNTIQGTDLGIPKDSIVISQIHEENGCDGSTDNCPCTIPVTLTKDDFKPVLLTLTSRQKRMVGNLRHLCHWGLLPIWSKLNDYDTLQELICGNVNGVDDNNHTSHVNFLEASFTELNISSPDITDTSKDEDIAEIQRCLQEIDQEIGAFPEEVLPECSSIQNVDNDLELTFSQKDESALDSEDGINEVEHQDSQEESLDLAECMGFSRYIPAPFIMCRTPAYIGRDDDPKVIEEVMSEFLTMTESTDEYTILGVDQKIAKCHSQIAKHNPKFSKMVKEVPLLHLQKMKVTNLCSAYKEAGLLHIIKYMHKNSTEDDIGKLLEINNIRHAVRHIKRFALSITLAMQITFMQSLDDESSFELLMDLQSETPDKLTTKWEDTFQTFLENRCTMSPTFSLHHDMMNHAIEIIGLNLSERIGGPNGYNLLQGCMKDSLAFSFLNGASFYASFCTELLVDHAKAPPLIQGIKKRYFSVPYEGSSVNFALDTLREEEHRKAKKFFRPRSDCNVVQNRMMRMEEVNEMQKKRSECLKTSTKVADTEDHINWNIDDVDVKFILRGASLIVRCKGLTDDSTTLRNVYASTEKLLSMAMLDSESQSCGINLIKRLCCVEKYCGITSEDVESDSKMLKASNSPKELVNKVLKGSSVTIKRSLCKHNVPKTSAQKVEEQRMKKLTQDQKKMTSLYSDQNTCQAIVNPTCSKYKVTKSLQVPKALIAATAVAFQHEDDEDSSGMLHDFAAVAPKHIPLLSAIVKNEELIIKKTKDIPHDIATSIKIITLENAGAYHKTGKDTTKGSEFIRQFQDKWLTTALTQYPNADTIAISEEKYKFTPNVFKQATRSQRQKAQENSIVHLQTQEEMLSEKHFCKESVTSTHVGKSIISTFIPQHAPKLAVNRDVVIIFDSELHMSPCQQYSIPMVCSYTKEGLKETQYLNNIEQRKGEAECAQVDWVLHHASKLESGEDIMSVVSSADIDAVINHLFAVALHMPRNENGDFYNRVFVSLKKSGVQDLYNITGIIRTLEKAFNTRTIVPKLAMLLCMAGNDYLPKFYGLSHLSFVKMFFKTENFQDNLFNFNSATVKSDVFLIFLKYLYCPSTLDPQKLTYDEVRQISIKPPKKKAVGKLKKEETVTFRFADGQVDVRPPHQWLLPAMCAERLVSLYGAMFKYLLGLGHHQARLPSFAQTCLTESGHYDLGPQSNVKQLKDLIVIDEAQLIEHKKEARAAKRTLEFSPRKDSKLQRTSTPKKPLMSSI